MSRFLSRCWLGFLCIGVPVLWQPSMRIGQASDKPDGSRRVYENKLVRIENPSPLLADHPEFIARMREPTRYAAPRLVNDSRANLSVRAWRFSYNARGIVEMPNWLHGDRTAIVVVHPWGVDDGQGWITPQPAGAAFQCTPEKNKLCRKHARTVVDPLLKRLRSRVGLVLYSLPGNEDPIRKKLYRSLRRKPSAAERKTGRRELAEKLKSFRYVGKPLPTRIELGKEPETTAYFRAFPGLDAGPRYDPPGFWDLPIPVMSDINVDPNDVVLYDREGYDALKAFLRKQGIRHVLLCGYNTDMCVCKTTAGYENLRNDFNVFLVGDATIATFPGNANPAPATHAAVAKASLNLLITQASWIQPLSAARQAKGR